MKYKNRIFIIMLAFILILSGCGLAGERSSRTDSSKSVSNNDISKAPGLKIIALKGPTGMGMAPLMIKYIAIDAAPYKFSIVGAPDEIAPMLAKKEADIAALPANLAAILSKKTNGEIQIIAINTLGVLSIVSKGDAIHSVSDLRGKTLYASGKGSTPEYILNYLLDSYGLTEDDVKIEWKSEHSECLAAISESDDANAAAMLPQPFVTSALMKIDGLKIALDLTEEWDKLQMLKSSDSALSKCVTGVLVARKEIAKSYPEKVDEFLKEYEESVNFVNENVDDAAKMIGSFEIVPENIAKDAIPKCNIVCITGGEMKEKLTGYYKVLFDQNPDSIGGSMPEDDLFYKAKPKK